MAEAPAPARFFFGAMSPYSWFAAERIERLLPDAQWCGVFVGGLFKERGRVSWGLSAERDSGMAECEARAAAHGLGPITWPDPWPTNDLLVARAMVFAARAPSGARASLGGDEAQRGDGRLKPFALAAMRLAFREGADLGEADAVLEAARRAGIDEGEMRAALSDPQIKQALRVLTGEALAAGVFGVPTVVVDGRLFWGDDRLDEAAAAQRHAGGAPGRG